MTIKHIHEIADGPLGASLSDEDTGNAVNERLAAIARELRTIFADYGEYVRPHEAGMVATQGHHAAITCHELAGPMHLVELSQNVKIDPPTYMESLSNEAIGQIVLNLPMTENGDPDSPIDGHLAVDVAKELGPDWAQALYRFAVLVTKLA